jgi:hypothetical protein
VDAAKPQHVLISCMKNEGPFILEWVAHHIVLGFDRIYIASNDCSDGSDQLLAALDLLGYITHVPHVVKPGDSPQHAGYKAIRKRHPIDAADWLMMLDADEFLNVHVGDHRVADLTARADDDIDVIALNGMVFTDAPQINWQPGRICPLFSNRVILKHSGNAAIKTLTRNPSRFKAIHNHSMVDFKGDQPLRVLWGDGTTTTLNPDLPLWKQLRNSPLPAISHRLAQYSHYSIKTWDSFMLRRARGRGAVAATAADPLRHSDAYFAARSKAAGQDLSIARYDAAVVAVMEEMMQHGKLRRRLRQVNALYAEMAAPYQRQAADVAEPS